MIFRRTEDCVNGSLVDDSAIPQPYMNFTTFLTVYGKSLDNPIDPTNVYVPSQHSLTIYNTSRLYINLEGCVNTLRGECREFLATHGRDGDNHTAQSRYPCFYNKVTFLFIKLSIATFINFILRRALFLFSAKKTLRNYARRMLVEHSKMFVSTFQNIDTDRSSRLHFNRSEPYHCQYSQLFFVFVFSVTGPGWLPLCP